jgi:hypothetical protein
LTAEPGFVVASRYVAGVRATSKLAEWLDRPATAVLRDLRGVRPIGSIAVVGTRVGGLNGLSVGTVEAPILREPLPTLDSDLDADGTRCDDHAEWPAGLGCTGLAFEPYST